MTQLSVFIATSLDGYIATPNGSLDWLENAGSPDEDYGWEAFLAGIDALAMGRGTWDHISHLDELPFGDRPVYVFTHRSLVDRPGVHAWSMSPREALGVWEERGHERVYVDGGQLISAFLAEGLIDDLTIFTAPVLLAVLQKIERRGALYLVKRAREIVGTLFRYAIRTGRASHDPSRDLHGAFVGHKEEHRPAIIDPEEFGALLDKNRGKEIELLIYRAGNKLTKKIRLASGV
jgi:dihydrofolate reductase